MNELGTDGRTQEQITGLIRTAVVKSHEGDGRVRVTFEDRDGVTSQPLQVVEIAGLDHSIPPVGKQVLCLMQPPDQVEGYVLGGLYRKGETPTTKAGTRIVGGTEILLGSIQAGHPVPFGDVLLRILQALREMAATVQVATPAGPGQLTATTTAYGAGTYAVIAAAMEADVQDAVLNSAVVRTE